jgi:AraC-like DNA-binding protein
MPRLPDNYFRYFATPPETAAWGLAVTAAGFTRIAPRAPYPPSQHPVDHELSWEHGRVLDALQLVLITRGRGVFESRATGVCEIGEGAAFAILPGTWHRYRPDKDTGWDESWMEVRGPLVEKLLRSGVFVAKHAVRGDVLRAGMELALGQVHAHSRNGAPGFSAPRTAAAFAVLSAWEQSARERPPGTPLARAVLKAEHFLSEHYAGPVDMRELAARLGVAYSHLRKAFKKHTGFAPWQYVLHLRLSHARRLLASRAVTLGDAAAQLGFNSEFHLSATFKKAHGLSPREWRRQLDKGA